MREIYKGENGNLLFRRSFCAYIDILGFSQKIVNNDLSFFSSYLTTLKEELKHIENMHDLSGKEGLKSFELKIFTLEVNGAAIDASESDSEIPA